MLYYFFFQRQDFSYTKEGCSSMSMNHTNQTRCKSSRQDLMEYVRQSGLVFSLHNLGVSLAKSHHVLTLADLGLFRHKPKQNSRSLLLNFTSFGPRANGAPEFPKRRLVKYLNQRGISHQGTTRGRSVLNYLIVATDIS